MVEAIDTSGRAVLFAGITVIISLLGLFLIGPRRSCTGVAIASAIGVLMMMLGSLTLLPALLGWVGTAHRQHDPRRADRRRARRRRRHRRRASPAQAAVFLVGFVLAIVFFALSFCRSSRCAS